MNWSKTWPKLARVGLKIASLFVKNQKALIVLDLGSPIIDAIEQGQEDKEPAPKPFENKLP